MSLSSQWLTPALDASIAAAFFTMVGAIIRFMRMRRGAALTAISARLAAALVMPAIAHAAVVHSAVIGCGVSALGARALEAIAAMATAGILLALLPRSVDPPGRAALLRSKA